MSLNFAYGRQNAPVETKAVYFYVTQLTCEKCQHVITKALEGIIPAHQLEFQYATLPEKTGQLRVIAPTSISNDEIIAKLTAAGKHAQHFFPGEKALDNSNRFKY